MSPSYIPGIFLAFGFFLAPQQSHTYPPINRNSEYFEKSLKRDEAKLREQRKQLLLDARCAAEAIVNHSRAIKTWSKSHFRGDLDRKKFQQLIKSLTKKVDRLTRSVEIISSIDPSFQDKPGTYEVVSSRERFIDLINELQILAGKLHQRVSDLTGGADTSVEDLRAPSLEALAKTVKTLSKVISKSVKKI